MLKAAIEPDVFTRIAAGAATVDDLATRCQAAPRGLRALLNQQVMHGLLTKNGEHYGLAAATKMPAAIKHSQPKVSPTRV